MHLRDTFLLEHTVRRIILPILATVIGTAILQADLRAQPMPVDEIRNDIDRRQGANGMQYAMGGGPLLSA